MKDIKAVIFDMDGVLVDTEPFYMQQVMDFFKYHKQTLPLSQASKLAGSSYQASWKMMASWWNVEISAEQMRQLYEEEYTEEPIDFAYTINPYVAYILPKLKAMNMKLAIASSSPKQAILEMCKACQITSYFDELISGHDFKESKPHPEIYQHTMEKLHVTNDECIVMEDSTYGIEAAKRAGITVIVKRDERFQYDQRLGNYVVSDMLEAYHLIEKLKRG